MRLLISHHACHENGTAPSSLVSVGVAVLVSTLGISVACAESLPDVMRRIESDALLGLRSRTTGIAATRSALRSPVLTAPLRLDHNPQREKLAQAQMEKVITLLNQLPSNAMGAKDWARPEVTTSLLSLVTQFDGTRVALSARLILGYLQTDMDACVDFHVGWQLLTHLANSRIQCWQRYQAARLMAGKILEYARSPHILRAELARLEAREDEWRALRRSPEVKQDVRDWIRATAITAGDAERYATYDPDNDSGFWSRRLRIHLRLGELRAAKEAMRQLRQSSRHGVADNKQHIEWERSLDQGGNPLKEGLMTISIGETHPPYPDEK